MKALVEQLVLSLGNGQALAYCRLVETRGSTPQKAGAMMLVFPSGQQAGTLGGGCVEAEVKRKALAVLESGQSEIATFLLDSDYGWDDGLICGGRMSVLVSPLAAGAVPEYFAELNDCLQTGLAATEAIVFGDEVTGTPRTASFLFNERGECVATLPGDSSGANAVATALKPIATRPLPYVASGVSYLPLLPRCPLVIVGGGHVGQAVGEMAAKLDFEICVVDDRPEFVSEARFPSAVRRVAGNIKDVLPALEITPSTFCLIVTRGHNHDQEALYYLADRGARYVGLIGSRRKIKMIFENLGAAGVSPKALAAVHAPVGLDIGSQTVPEIAVSICAELISERNGKRRVNDDSYPKKN